MVVFDEEQTVYRPDAQEVDPYVARTFEAEFGTEGRHGVAVRGDGFEGRLEWDGGVCRRYEARMRVTGGSVETSGEGVQER